ncbi:MAG: DNA primase [Alphaproteobacteria bacterium]
MRFSPDFLDELRLRLRIADVVGRKVKLVRRGKEHTGLCPFHKEKTPSFTVNDDKGFYHCFGCGAHGDVIKFAMETEGLAFPEAVERLAGEAGLQLPAYSDSDREKDDRRQSLHEVLETATKWFEAQLRAGIGQGALAYVRDRGLDQPLIESFRLGFAPDNRTMLRDAMKARGVTDQQLADTGLVITPEDGGEPYDRFRNRLIFPITDRRGRVVAFGGRALGDARAKYLNSPETELFHKGTLLYNLSTARAASRAADRLIIVEGYMDVIGLARGGFKEAVAPLGTALTEQQLIEAWRLVPEPILCFDGDNAGMRAAERAIERALPNLAPGQSLRFATLPAGEDPDSLVAAQGAPAMQAVLDSAQSLVDLLWRVELERQPVDTPERRAGFKARLQERLKEIRNPDVNRLYRDEFGVRLQALWAPPRQQRPGPGRGFRPAGARGYQYQPPVSRELLNTPLARGQDFTNHRRERLILLTVLNHPMLLERHEEEILAVDLASPELDKLREAILRIAASCSAAGEALDSLALKNHLHEEGLDKAVSRLEGDKGLVGEVSAQPDADVAVAGLALQSLLENSRLALLEKELLLAEAERLSQDPQEARRADERAKDLRLERERLKALQASLGEN